MAITHRLAQPGMPAYIDIDRAIKGADPTLDAASRIGHNLTRHQRLAAGRIAAE
jgi:hypothetical protein